MRSIRANGQSSTKLSMELRIYRRWSPATYRSVSLSPISVFSNGKKRHILLSDGFFIRQTLASSQIRGGSILQIIDKYTINSRKNRVQSIGPLTLVAVHNWLIWLRSKIYRFSGLTDMF